MSEGLAGAWRAVSAGDVPATVRHLRGAAADAPVDELARVVERLATAVRLDDLAGAARRLADDPETPQTQYDFGYACIEHDLPFLAIPPLQRALRAVPDERAVRSELAVAYEAEHRHGEVVAILEERDDTLEPWPYRYLLVFNAIMAGDLARARHYFDRLPEPEGGAWQPALARVRRMLDRAELAGRLGPLDDRDLRGWHFVLTGGVLGTLSPYGFGAGMTGRWAYLQDTHAQCLLGLRRLRLVLAATGRSPRSVSLLPDRSSRILGLAAAELLGLPAEPFAADGPETVVVAYDLRDADEESLAALHERVPGQLLYEHATCWTSPPAVAADVSTLLHQVVVAPWGERMRRVDGDLVTEPADGRPAEEIAAEILRAGAEPEPGDGETPADPDEVLTGFAAGVAGRWLTGPRDRSRSPGPVRSSRFR
ncbi:hypothetical protein AB0J86_32790 [Micromonospora sp. NPDC049559]|uniref:hypothetical protein n=1 Tax=Micromonospora sp. NPDC049559 TaxID=3155923 RepID=UPI00343C24C3